MQTYQTFVYAGGKISAKLHISKTKRSNSNSYNAFIGVTVDPSIPTEERPFNQQYFGLHVPLDVAMEKGLKQALLERVSKNPAEYKKRNMLLAAINNRVH